MLIGIDGNEANVEKKVGISGYVFELIHQFEKFHPPTGGSNFKFQIYLKKGPEHNLPEERKGWEYKVFGPGKMWTQFALPLHLYLDQPTPSVFFTPTHYAPRFSPIPSVISIMDLSYIHYPEMFKQSDLYQLKNWTDYSVRKAAKIITISNSSKNDIINYYKVDSDKVVVVYPGIKMESSKFKIQSSKFLTESYGVEKKYILFVGTLQPRKNISKLIEAFSNLKNKDLDLVIVGKKGWLYEEILEAPDKFGVEKSVKFLDYVSDEDLPSLYKNAICLVFPSLYEGFGLPVLEAMKHGCPVLASNVSSLPEAGGEAAIYFNPENVSDITEKIETVLKDDVLREKMRGKGFEQVKKFSWEKAAKETLDVLKQVAEAE